MYIFLSGITLEVLSRCAVLRLFSSCLNEISLFQISKIN